MNDDPQTPATPQTQPPSEDAAQNPLDALEQILKQAKGESADAGEDPEVLAEQERQKKEEEAKQREQLAALQREEDAQRLAQQISDLDSVKEMPQYHARQAEEHKAEEEAQAEEAKADGYKIQQLEHTKK